MLKKALLRFAVPLRWQVRGSPSVANPLGGIKLHRSFICFRFAQGLFQLASPRHMSAGCSIFQTLACLKSDAAHPCGA
ncbi:MAG: hypothetical protein BMS9Abin10_0448 [Gammaproteobacteria bacterium]|nr:MAG: hypothetical protein BMS9Abin10_0448 [Gammaproteobacteria bacterium]